jgi:hypothetical protein
MVDNNYHFNVKKLIKLIKVETKGKFTNKLKYFFAQ